MGAAGMPLSAGCFSKSASPGAAQVSQGGRGAYIIARELELV